MCLGAWSLMGYVKNQDIMPVASLPEVCNEEELGYDWDWM